jgi:hypothetical protein
MTLGVAGAAVFVLMALDFVPRTPSLAIALVCVMASGLLWALPGRDA